VVSGAAVMNRSVIFLPLGLVPAPACSPSAFMLTAARGQRGGAEHGV
jgi:hypothetical protein